MEEDPNPLADSGLGGWWGRASAARCSPRCKAQEAAGEGEIQNVPAQATKMIRVVGGAGGERIHKEKKV